MTTQHITAQSRIVENEKHNAGYTGHVTQSCCAQSPVGGSKEKTREICRTLSSHSSDSEDCPSSRQFARQGNHSSDSRPPCVIRNWRWPTLAGLDSVSRPSFRCKQHPLKKWEGCYIALVILLLSGFVSPYFVRVLQRNECKWIGARVGGTRKNGTRKHLKL